MEWWMSYCQKDWLKVWDQLTAIDSKIRTDTVWPGWVVRFAQIRRVFSGGVWWRVADSAWA